MSPILALPLELLEKIVLELLLDAPTILPLDASTILPLLLTSKHFRTALSNNSHLYASLFRASFDVSAPVRRLGYLDASGLRNQFRANYSALRAIRRRDVRADNILGTFWTAFSMLLENDGKNRSQLNDAGLPDFIDSFVRERLYDSPVDGWPAENELNSLALWLLWMSTTEDRLRAQSSTQRAQMTRLILPFVLMPIRYAGCLAPHVHSTLPLQSTHAQSTHSFVTAHGHYPHYRTGFSRKIPLYNSTIKLGIPLASVTAKLIYFAHREVFPVGVPPHLPRTRAHAFQLGLLTVGPTQEDVQELNDHKVARFVPESRWDWWNDIPDYHNIGFEAGLDLAPSARWDDDWNRLADCNSLFTPISLKRMHYTPGLLSGLWQGRMLYPDDGLYENVMRTRQIPPSFSEQSVGLTAAPVFMRLREYHCMDVHPNEPVASGGIQNAWFHSSARFHEVTHGLAITCQERSSTYNEYIVGGSDLHDESRCRGCEYRGTSEMIFRENDERYLATVDQHLLAQGSPEDDDDDSMDEDSSDQDMDTGGADGDELVIRRKCNGILDIVLVGETDHRHGQAWQHYNFYGRVREWDGLVAIIRVPAHPANAALGVWVFTGYVVGGQNFVGNWRTTTHPGEPVAIEGAFAMSKRE